MFQNEPNEMSDNEFDEQDYQNQEKVHLQQIKQQNLELSTRELAYNVYYIFKDFNVMRPRVLCKSGLFEFNQLFRYATFNDCSVDIFNYNYNKNQDRNLDDFLYDYHHDINENYMLLSRFIKIDFNKFLAFCVKYSDV